MIQALQHMLYVKAYLWKCFKHIFLFAFLSNDEFSDEFSVFMSGRSADGIIRSIDLHTEAAFFLCVLSLKSPANLSFTSNIYLSDNDYWKDGLQRKGKFLISKFFVKCCNWKKTTVII